MKRIMCVVLVAFFILVPTMATASGLYIPDMTFDELIALRTEIDERIRELYPEYDYVLASGEYFVGIDFSAGDVMLYYLRNDEEVSSYCEVDDSDGEMIWQEYLRTSSPREKCSFYDGNKITIERGPIGIKYLDD